MYQNNEFQLLICLKIDFLNFWQKGVTIKRMHILIIKIMLYLSFFPTLNFADQWSYGLGIFPDWRLGISCSGQRL